MIPASAESDLYPETRQRASQRLRSDVCIKRGGFWQGNNRGNTATC
jgi:hypothetical protein